MWYSAKLLFESSVDDSLGRAPLQEASIRLIQADDREVAQSKAEMFGKESEHGYLNASGNRVEWKFIRVLDIQDLCEPELYDGVEVYSELNWKADDKGAAK